LKIIKFNIGIEENLKIASIGDYWDNQTMEIIIELLHEYSDLFPPTFLEMKGIRKRTSRNTYSSKTRFLTNKTETLQDESNI
jgi:hypothetical protein